MKKKDKIINFTTWDYGEVLDSETKRVLEDSISNETTILNYVAVNGKCGWCGIDIKGLPNSHFEDHETTKKSY